MSRFVAWLDALAGVPLDSAALRTQLAAMLDRLQATEGRVEAAFRFFLRKRAPVSGVQSLLDYEGRWIAETRGGAHGGVGGGGGAGEEPVPLLEGDLRLRRAQPALARDRPRGTAAAHRVERARALRGRQRVERDLAAAQACRREVDHRARVREPQVRRGSRARRRAAAECRPAGRALRGGCRELRVASTITAPTPASSGRSPRSARIERA